MIDVIVCKVPETEDCPSGLKIVVPAKGKTIEDAILTLPAESEGHFVTRREALIQDRYFRNAWKLDLPKQSISVDMVKAKAVHIDRLRVKRNERLNELDIEWFKAATDLERKTIERQKQNLRNMPDDDIFNLPNTPDELKKTIPGYME